MTNLAPVPRATAQTPAPEAPMWRAPRRLRGAITELRDTYVAMRAEGHCYDSLTELRELIERLDDFAFRGPLAEPPAGAVDPWMTGETP